MADHVPAKTLRALDDRDAQRARHCVLTGIEGERIVPQHRQGGMGGRKNKHQLANLVWLDSIFNGLIEDDADWAAIATAWGVKVPVWVKDVTAVPVFFRQEFAWFVLEGDGRREISPTEALDMMIAVYGEVEYFRMKAVADATDRALALYRRAVA